MISHAQIAAVFVESADTLVGDYDSVDFLHRLVEQVAAVSGADAVGLMLTDAHQHLQVFAASNEDARLLGLRQLQVSEGPCLECFTSQAPVVESSLASAVDRWPRFAASAMRAGFVSTLAYPMRLKGTAIGALNLLSRTHPGLDPVDGPIVQALADIATIAILHERNLSRAEALTEQLQGAFTARIVIEQAKGALAQLEGITPAAAFDRLRAQARRERRKLVDLAEEVLEQLGHQR